MSSSKILDAVTAVLLKSGAAGGTTGPELLMVRRQDHLKSFSGYWAFPGGRVDAADAVDDGVAAAFTLDGVTATTLRALVRELREEVALDLGAIAARGGVRGVALLGCATTPPAVLPVRFRTQFVRVDLDGAVPAPTPDLGEIAAAEWATPSEWLARYERGTLLAAPPTLDVLRALAADPDVRAIPDFDDDRLPAGAESLRTLQPLNGLHQIPVRSNTLPPATHTNAWLFGDTHKVLVDPSPADRAEYARLLATLDRIGVDEVLLTHHHPDHRQFANELAAHYGVPLAMSDDTRKRITALDPSWLGELVVRVYVEGDVATRWLGRPVRVVAVPGHDEGQLALMPDDRSWFLAGDLLQGVGTVVIRKPEGHMGRYFATLRKVIALAPAVTLPSHGQASGGTHRLEEILKHRQAREDAVLVLHREGLSPEQMLPKLYADVDPRLHALAANNIESHLDKLAEEGKL